MVPTLCVGTRGSTLRVEGRTQSVQRCVPTQSVGTRCDVVTDRSYQNGAASQL
jgi:hypothetical protein